jgi:hypothetical protein
VLNRIVYITLHLIALSLTSCSLFLIQLIPRVEISPIRLFPELIQPQIPNQINCLRRTEPLDDIRARLRSRQDVDCVAIDL